MGVLGLLKHTCRRHLTRLPTALGFENSPRKIPASAPAKKWRRCFDSDSMFKNEKSDFFDQYKTNSMLKIVVESWGSDSKSVDTFTCITEIHANK